jgi:hypothetical protein
MKRHVRYVGAWLLAGILVSCGGGGGGDSPGASTPPASTPPATTPPGNGSPAGPAASGVLRVEESDVAAVTFSGAWSPSDSRAGWSGGAAMESTQRGAMASFTFTGTSVRWLSSRGRNGGIALVRVDGGEAREVDLFARPNDEFHTPAITIYGLSAGQHTLTIEVTGKKNEVASSPAKVVVDAFEVNPQIVSHAQEADPDATYSAGWSQASNNLNWSGSGAFNAGELPPGAKVTEKAGASVTFKFRGTSVSWSGYSGPDAGIALVSVDGGAPREVDTYSSEIKVQQVVFTSAELADTPHTLTIQATGRKNAASSAAKIFVDAFDVTTPGRRHEQGDVRRAKHFEDGDTTISYFGAWNHNDARVWTEESSATSNQQNATVTFTFTGTSVSWIGCEKASAGGSAKIFLDGAFVKEVNLFKRNPIEGFQTTIFRADGLVPGPHELKIQVSSNSTSYVVIDAFDVRP